MIILHAGWESGELYFWGEIPAIPSVAAPRRRPRTPRDTQQLPFDAGAAREFDRDPFLVFKLRGLSREELIKRLGQTTPQRPARKPSVEKGAAAPLPADPARFWTGGELAEVSFGEVQTPPVSAALPQGLGNFPFWRGHDHFLDSLAPIYRAASAAGMSTFLGERPKHRASEPVSRTA